MTENEADQSDTQTPEAAPTSGDERPQADTSEPVYNDPDKLDFDPKDGLLSGTAIKGGTEIPGEHQMVDDVALPDEDEDSGSESDGESD